MAVMANPIYGPDIVVAKPVCGIIIATPVYGCNIMIAEPIICSAVVIVNAMCGIMWSDLCVITVAKQIRAIMTASPSVARKRPRSFGQKGRWQVTPKHEYTRDPVKSEWADTAV